jgi:hypothetical protein
LVADKEKRRQDEWERELRDRSFDLLKHVSTLNLAALVLLLALIENYREVLLAGLSIGPSTGALLMFGLSLLLSVLGLILFTFIRCLFVVPYLVVVSYVLFFVGVALAVFFTYGNMY